MIIGYILDDGGRAAAGFKGDVGDCVVRAIAILTRIPYRDVYRRMATAMNQAGYAASGDNHRQKPRPGLPPRLSVRRIRNLVRTSCGLRRGNPGRGPHPTYTEAWPLHGDCLVGTARHISAIVDGNLRDTGDGRLYDGRPYGGSAADQRKAQSVWVPAGVDGRPVAVPEFDPARAIRRSRS